MSPSVRFRFALKPGLAKLEPRIRVELRCFGTTPTVFARIDDVVVRGERWK